MDGAGRHDAHRNAHLHAERDPEPVTDLHRIAGVHPDGYFHADGYSHPNNHADQHADGHADAETHGTGPAR